MFRNLILAVTLASFGSAAPAAPGNWNQQLKVMKLKPVSGTLQVGTYVTTLTFRGDTCPFPPQATPVGQPVSGKMQVSAIGNGLFSFDLPSATSYFKTSIPVNAAAGGTLSYAGPVSLHLTGFSDLNLAAGLQGTSTQRSFLLSGPLRNGSQCAIDITLEGSLTH